MKFKPIASILFLYLVFCIPRIVQAENAAYQVPVGKGLGTNNGVIETFINGTVFSMMGTSYNSYCCEMHVNDPNVTSVKITRGILETTEGRSFEQPFTYTGDQDPMVPFSPADEDTHGTATRACFTVPHHSDLGYGHVFYLVPKVINPTEPDTAHDVRVFCDDTTLFGGFNTMVTDFNFLELSNTAYLNMKVTILFSPINKEPFTKEFTINSRSRFDVDVHSIVGKGTYGSIQIAHNGPKGSLRAELVQYRITSENPLKFDPVSRQVLRAQDQ